MVIVIKPLIQEHNSPPTLGSPSTLNRQHIPSIPPVHKVYLEKSQALRNMDLVRIMVVAIFFIKAAMPKDMLSCLSVFAAAVAHRSPSKIYHVVGCL